MPRSPVLAVLAAAGGVLASAGGVLASACGVLASACGVLASACGVLASACGAPDVQPLDVAKRLEPEKAVPKDSKADPAPAPDPSPAPAPAAFERLGDAAGQRDDLAFWGWSRDGLRYAFEVHDHGPGAATCEGSYTLYVVDAARDAFADGTPLQIKHKSPDAEKCDPPDLSAEIARHRPEVLHRHGIEVGHLRLPIAPQRVSAAKPGNPPAWTFALGGAPITAALSVRHGGREHAGEPGAAYELTLRRGEDPPVVVEPGTRRRPFVWDYSLDNGLVFVAPDGAHLAILVATKQLSFEGDRHSYMSNGLAVPAGWGAPPPP